MDMSAGQSTLRHPLPLGWVRKLFAELQGNYGRGFDMRRSGVTDTNGDDVGLQNARHGPRSWPVFVSGRTRSAEC